MVVDAKGVPEGYKRTEMGVIPESWKLATLSDICVFENGDRGIYYPSKSDFKSFGHPFVNAGHVNDGIVNVAALDYITSDKFNQLRSGKYKIGDILFCLRGSLGKFGVIDDNSANGAIASSLVIVRPKAKKTLLEFVVEYFRSKACLEMIEIWSGGAAQPNLGAVQLSQFKLALPPLEEQIAIAEALADTDEAIRSLEAVIAKKRDVKQATLHALLTPTRRLPGFSGEWELRPLGDLLKVMHGKSQHHVIDPDGIYPILATGGQIGKTNHFLHNLPSVLIGRKGTIDKPQYMDQPFWSVDTLFFTIITDPNVPKFLYYSALLIPWKSYNEASGVPSLNAKTIEGIEIKVPKPEEQSAIATILTDIDAEIEDLKARLDKLRDIKQGMMQVLLTGKVRLI